MSTIPSIRAAPSAGAGRRWSINAGYVYVLPAIALLSLVLLIPLAFVLYLSVHRDIGRGAMAFAGLGNYQRFLADPQFWNAMRNTVVFTVGSVALHVLLGLGVALLLNRSIKGRTIFRVVALVPWMFSSVVVAAVWRWMYSPQFGIINDILDRTGISRDAQIAWLGHLDLALPAVTFANAWRGFPFVMIIVLAGLQAIPREQYEAAAVDGASGYTSFRHVTLPNLRFVLSIAVILDSIWTFKYFDLVQVMTGGGPANATEVLTTLVYRNAFEYFQFGYASAIAVLMFLVSLVFTLVYVRLAMTEKGTSL
jgi:multiple sugar transport system permease protein